MLQAGELHVHFASKRVALQKFFCKMESLSPLTKDLFRLGVFVNRICNGLDNTSQRYDNTESIL